jgi:hypothetical protein
MAQDERGTVVLLGKLERVAGLNQTDSAGAQASSGPSQAELQAELHVLHSATRQLLAELGDPRPSPIDATRALYAAQRWLNPRIDVAVRATGQTLDARC